GLTVATLLEAEAFAFAEGGCPSIFIAYPLWAGSGGRAARLAALRDQTDLRVGVDSAAAAAQLAEAAPGLRVLVQVDSGQQRSGTVAGSGSAGWRPSARPAVSLASMCSARSPTRATPTPRRPTRRAPPRTSAPR